MELGQKVEFVKKYKRVEIRAEEDDDPWTREWIIENIKKTSGLFIGFRVLKNTSFHIEIDDEDGEPCGIGYNTSKYIKCGLVAINKSQLMYVPLGCL